MFLYIVILIVIAFFLMMLIEEAQTTNEEKAKQKTYNHNNVNINDKVQTKNTIDHGESAVAQRPAIKKKITETISVNNDDGDYSWINELTNKKAAGNTPKITKAISVDNDARDYSWIDELINKEAAKNTPKIINNVGKSSSQEEMSAPPIGSSKIDLLAKKDDKTSVIKESRSTTEKKRVSPIEEKPYTIYVGLDFGTSSTKVAYRISGGTEKVIPLSISNMPNMHYAQPSLIAFCNEEILFGEEAYKYLEKREWDLGIKSVKMLFAGEIDPDYKNEELFDSFVKYCGKNNIGYQYLNPGYWVSAYLIWITRKIRMALQNQYKRDINLNINICIPMDTFEKDNVRKEFQKAINVVDEIGRTWNGKNDMSLIENIAQLWDCADTEEMGDARIHIVPEAVAQMACYLDSLAVENKIHGVIDFGSGTTDFSIFNLQKDADGERCAYWLNAVTYPKGMYDVERLVAKNTDKTLDYRDLKYVIEHSYKQTETIQNEIKDFLYQLWKQSRYEVWGEAYGKEIGQNKWQKENVRIFVCGGGSGLEDVKDIFKESWYKDDYVNWGPYQVEKLTVPDDLVLEGINYYDFPRLAVAYGLTTPRPKLHKYVLPKDFVKEESNKDKSTSSTGGYFGAVYIDTH